MYNLPYQLTILKVNGEYLNIIIGFFKQYVPYIKGRYSYFIIAICGALLYAASNALIAYMVSPLLGSLNGKIPQNAIFNFENMSKHHSLALIMAIIIVALYLLKSIGAYVQAYFMNFIGQDIVREVRDKMLKHMLSLELAFFNKMRGGELMARITNDIGMIRSAVSNYIADFFREIVTMIGLIIVVINQNPKLAFFGLIIIPISVIPFRLIIKKIKTYSNSLLQQNANITAKLNEIFNNIEIIKASNGENLEAKHFEKQNKQFLTYSMKSVRYNELTTPLMELLGAIALAVVIYIAITEINNGNLTSEQFASFTAALFMVYTPLKRIVNIIGGMQGASAANKRIQEVLDRKPLIIEGTKELKAPIKQITLNNVYFDYDDKKHALDGITLNFNRNEITALVGKSGGGKSTLVNLILRLYDCKSGEICINGVNIKEFTQKSLRNNIAIVTQRIFIFNDTIAKNVAYGLEIDDEKIKKALKDAQILDYVESLPDSIHTVLDEFGTNLSGGQRQRIAIARAMYKNPDILILDEVTSALDSKTEDMIKEAININRKDKIIILIAHRPSTIELANKIVSIQNGKIESIKDNI